jgi:endonuclease/exonuclease/phosphatase family metal-dependent hydrolase
MNSFSFLSWNLGLMENSYGAPVGWRVDQTESLVRERVLATAPDFVCFQELPGLVPYVETHELIPANTVSHCGNLATLVRRDLLDQVESRAVGKCAVLTAIESAGISIANVHLPPGSNGKAERLSAIQRLVSICPTSRLVVIGDTNTRIGETPSIEALGLLGDLPPSPTWDSRINRFRADGKKYTAYFTRYFYSDGVAVKDVRVFNQAWDLEGSRFFLSDHFALAGRVELR